MELYNALTQPEMYQVFTQSQVVAALCNHAEFKQEQSEVPVLKHEVNGDASEAAILKCTDLACDTSKPQHTKNNFAIGYTTGDFTKAIFMVFLILMNFGHSLALKCFTVRYIFEFCLHLCIQAFFLYFRVLQTIWLLLWLKVCAKYYVLMVKFNFMVSVEMASFCLNWMMELLLVPQIFATKV